MKVRFLVVFVVFLLVFAGLFFSVRRTSAEAEGPYFPYITVEFRGVPQWHTAQIINAGTLTLTLDTSLNSGASPADMGLEVFRVSTVDSRVFELSAHWASVDVDLWEWVQYIPLEVNGLTFSQAHENVYITWITDWDRGGPWGKTSDYGGITKFPLVRDVSAGLHFVGTSGVFTPTLDVWPDSQYLPYSYTVQVQGSCLYTYTVSSLGDGPAGLSIVASNLISATYVIKGPSGTDLFFGEVFVPDCSSPPPTAVTLKNFRVVPWWHWWDN